MSYINRMYFNKATGDLLQYYSMEGDIFVPTIDQDLGNFTALQGYVVEQLIILEIPEEDIETRQKISNATNMRLDLATNDIDFDFTPPAPSIIAEPVDEEKVAIAEAVIALETRILELEGQINA